MPFEHRSRFYPAPKSWTHSPAWAFEIPLDRIEGLPSDSKVLLKCQASENSASYLVLEVPISFLIENKPHFYIRSDPRSISLFLSAGGTDKFTERRGDGQVSFQRFLTR